MIVGFLSTLSLRRATFCVGFCLGAKAISIHALLAESDHYGRQRSAEASYFYPRSPCGERHVRRGFVALQQNFYPRSPCGERHLRVLDGSKSSIISIHALLAESDTLRKLQLALGRNFYPRSPCGERHCNHTKGKKRKTFLSTLSLRRATEAIKPS